MKPSAVLLVFLLASACLSVFFSTVPISVMVGWQTVYASMEGRASTMASGGAAFGNATFTPPVHQVTFQSQSQPSLAAKDSLPSPFLVAACIVGLVALFGALLSLFWGRRRGKQASTSGIVGERFWAID